MKSKEDIGSGEKIGKEEKLRIDFENLIYSCKLKRELLERAYRKIFKIKKIIELVSSITILGSLLILTTIFIEFFTNELIETLSLSIAMIGAIVFIMSSAANRTNDLLNLISGANEFLQLRENTKFNALNESFSYNLRVKKYKICNDEYVKLSIRYDKYIKKYRKIIYRVKLSSII